MYSLSNDTLGSQGVHFFTQMQYDLDFLHKLLLLRATIVSISLIARIFFIYMYVDVTCGQCST